MLSTAITGVCDDQPQGTTEQTSRAGAFALESLVSKLVFDQTLSLVSCPHTDWQVKVPIFQPPDLQPRSGVRMKSTA
jgi:hypothetical protein